MTIESTTASRTMRHARPFRSLFRALKTRLAIARVTASAALHRATLPPGSLRPAPESALRDPQFLLRQSQQHGPVFKVWLDGKMTTCVVGLSLGRRFLADHEQSIRAATTDFQPLFPHGTLRQMTGDPHHTYRRLFIEAFKNVQISEHRAHIGRIVSGLLEQFAAAGSLDFDEIRDAVKRALTEIFFLLVFGIDRDWHGFNKLVGLYDLYAPNGTFLTVRAPHASAYASIKLLLLERERELQNSCAPSCLLLALSARKQLDDTAIGNLIQLTEAGRFDVMGLWAWLIKLLSDQPSYLEELSRTSANKSEHESLSRAIVLEALRLEQSEFVLRVATKDIVFDGYFIPRRSRVRIAVWDSHKDADNFTGPFQFEPRRFIGTRPGAEAYSPFGLDKHTCLGADWVIVLSMMFVESLADTLRWDSEGPQQANRGVFHFQPDKNATVRFRKAAG